MLRTAMAIFCPTNTTSRLPRVTPVGTEHARTILKPRNSENSKSQQDRNYERSRGIWTNLFGGSKKNSEENSEK
jgi:hypothetical protein